MKIIPRGKYTWIVLLFIAYVYYKDYRETHKVAPQSVNIAAQDSQKQAQPGTKVTSQPNNLNNTPKVESLTDKVVSKLKENDTAKVVLEALAKKAVEDKYGKGDVQVIAARKTGTLTIVDVIRGGGAELHCGATAVINYEASMSNGFSFDSTKSNNKIVPVTISTGRTQVIKGLESGIVGMREGGRRKISVPPELGFNMPGFDNSVLSKDDIALYDVELIEVKDGPYKNGLTVDIRNESEGSGNKVLCGDKIRMKYSLKKLNGAAITTAPEEATFILGTGTVPMGFEYSVKDMKIGGKRTVVIPYPLLKTVAKSTLKTEIKFDKDEAVKADIEVIEANY